MRVTYLTHTIFYSILNIAMAAWSTMILSTLALFICDAGYVFFAFCDWHDYYNLGHATVMGLCQHSLPPIGAMDTTPEWSSTGSTLALTAAHGRDCLTMRFLHFMTGSTLANGGEFDPNSDFSVFCSLRQVTPDMVLYIVLKITC